LYYTSSYLMRVPDYLYSHCTLRPTTVTVLEDVQQHKATTILQSFRGQINYPAWNELRGFRFQVSPFGASLAYICRKGEAYQTE
jgi:hypothetical protein